MKTSLILHSCPPVTWSGADYWTSTDALTDGKSQRATRVGFAGGALTDYVEPVCTWTTPRAIRGGWMIIDKGGRAGMRVEVRGRRVADAGYTYPLGGNSLTGRTVERDDGTIAIAWVFDDGIDDVVGIAFRLFDDADGSTFVDTYIDIGEIFIGQGEWVNIRREFSDEADDPTQDDPSVGNQPHVVERKRALVLSIEICPVDWDDAYMQPASLKWLRERLLGRRNCVIIPAFRAPATGGTSPIDWDVVQKVAQFGKCSTVGALQSLPQGPYWSLRITQRESPGRIAAPT